MTPDIKVGMVFSRGIYDDITVMYLGKNKAFVSWDNGESEGSVRLGVLIYWTLSKDKKTIDHNSIQGINALGSEESSRQREVYLDEMDEL